MILIQPHAEGATLAVRAQPGAKRNGILGEHSGALKVAVTAPPLDGRANDAILDLLASWLGAKRSHLELLRGASNRNKVVLLKGITAEALAATIEQLSG
jgi:uncharacterized protein (TIGR00251 family)